MSVDLAHFTPFASISGGLLIGAAAALLILGAGRVLGAAGLHAGLVNGPFEPWRLSWLAGLLASAALARSLLDFPQPLFLGSAATILLGGFLVGVGARLGNGCTSGHGVCGVARLSPRSLVATAVFMAAGFAATFLLRHVLS